MSTITGVKQLCPGGCREELDPSYITNTVIIDGEQVEVCDVCFGHFEECGRCHNNHHRNNVNKDYIGHEWGYSITCHDCAEREHNDYEEAMEQRYEEWRLEGRRLA